MLEIPTRAPGLARDISSKSDESLTIGDGNLTGLYSEEGLATRGAVAAQERVHQNEPPNESWGC